MGIQTDDRVIVVSERLSVLDTTTLTPKAARHALRAFCLDNGFTQPIINRTFSMFAAAARQPGEAYTVRTSWRNGGTGTARSVHACMQAITDNSIATGLAQIGFDAAPGTSFVHGMHEDACLLLSEVTNAPAAA
jgi:hypothetical protein